jgi:hypothetical protein
LISPKLFQKRSQFICHASSFHLNPNKQQTSFFFLSSQSKMQFSLHILTNPNNPIQHYKFTSAEHSEGRPKNIHRKNSLKNQSRIKFPNQFSTQKFITHNFIANFHRRILPRTNTYRPKFTSKHTHKFGQQFTKKNLQQFRHSHQNRTKLFNALTHQNL